MQVSKKVRLQEEQDIIQDTLLHLKHAYLLWENIVHLLANELAQTLNICSHRIGLHKQFREHFNRGRVVS